MASKQQCDHLLAHAGMLLCGPLPASLLYYLKLTRPVCILVPNRQVPCPLVCASIALTIFRCVAVQAMELELSGDTAAAYKTLRQSQLIQYPINLSSQLGMEQQV